MTTTDLFFTRTAHNLKLVIHESRATTDATAGDATTPDQQLARAIGRSGHGPNWPYLLALPEKFTIRGIRAVVLRYGFAREAIVTTCTTHGETLSFASPGARASHELVRFDTNGVALAGRNDVERGALDVAASALGCELKTAIRVSPTDRGADSVHQIMSTIAREHRGVVVKWSGRTGESDTFDVLRP